MTMIKGKLILFLIGILNFVNISAQVSEGGLPPSFKYPKFLKSEAFNTLTVPVSLNINELRKEDELAREIGAPARFAISIPVDVDIDKTGEWSVLPNGEKVWQQTVEASGALGLIISYKDFYIPNGGKLFIYNEDKSHVLGAYTAQTNPGGGRFSNEIINGSKFTMEYVESPLSNDSPRLKVRSVGYIYDKSDKKDTFSTNALYDYTLRIGRSQSCMINVNCSEGNNWQKQKRGVVHIAMEFSNSWYMCSGSLVNNTSNDGTPYVLTANHCFYHEPPQTVEEADYSTAQFYFNFEHPTCSNETTMPTTTKSLVGSELKVRLPYADKSDGLLVKLKENVPADWKPYYNGWDASNSAVTSGVVIHHPYGDVKKISTYTRQLESIYFTGTPVGSYWRAYYATTTNGRSVTEGGSSGSPIFNQNGLIVGTLTGGSSYCTSRSDGGPDSPDEYGKMWYHFNQSPTESQRMKPYLDPNNLNVTSYQGYDPLGPGDGISSVKKDVQIAVFPNPVENELYVNTRSIIKYVRIMDMFGHKVLELNSSRSSTMTIPVSNLREGVYLVIVKTEQGVYSDKIMKK